MKNLTDVLVVKKEDDVNLEIRREDYALKRDLQASDQNKAIAKRMLSEDAVKVKCEKCGKEFSSDEDSGDYTECPECR